MNGGIYSTGGVFVAGGTLGGTGVIGGPVTIQTGGTLALGNSIGSLTINKSLTLGGTTLIKLNKSLLTNDQIQGISTLNYGGTLIVTNLAGTLAIGDSFKIFHATNYNDGFATLKLPPLGAGQFWNTNALTNGVMSVVLGAVSPHFGQASLSGANLVVSGSGGAADYNYSVFAGTNLASPFTNWSMISTGSFDGNGNFIFSNAISPQPSQQFYEIEIP